MTIVDTERKEKIDAEDRLRVGWYQMVEGALRQTKDSDLVPTVTNLEHQKGKSLTTVQFVEKLRKLNPDIVLVPNTAQPGFASLYLNVGGESIYLFPCEGEWMPEWSVMAVNEERRPVEGTTRWEKVKVPGREIRRGWRTVLARLIQRRVVTEGAVEKEFGVGDRLSWAALLGKTKDRPRI